MSGVITAVLNATFGLLVDNARDYTAEKLKEGDLTDEQCRKFIVRELDDIKSKLDGLARKDLLSSVNFFEEGLTRLYLSIHTNSPSDETELEVNTNVEGMRRGERFAVLGEALRVTQLKRRSRAVRQSGLKITSEERFRSAKESFKVSREEATRAFSNEALSIEDRIFAIKLRMASTILERLEDPDAAASDCLLYLQALHAMPAVQEMFFVYLDGGIIRSLLNKAQRFEIVKSVTMVNFALFGFTKGFTKAPVDLFNWPRIAIGKRSYHPLCDQETRILREMKNSLVEAPSCEITWDLSEENYTSRSAVNSKREIIIASKMTGNFNILNNQGEIKLFCSLPQEEIEEGDFYIHSLAIDDEDNVYILTSFAETDNVYSFKVFVFDAEGILRHQFPLDFLSGGNGWVQTAINMAKNIIIHKAGESRVHVCNKDGQLQYSFLLEKNIDIVYVSISNKNEIVVAPRSGNTVYIYTEEGELERTIELPEDHKVSGSVAFSHITKKVIVRTEVQLSHTYHLLSYSETGELQTLPLRCDVRGDGYLSSHASGPVAFVHEKGVLFI